MEEEFFEDTCDCSGCDCCGCNCEDGSAVVLFGVVNDENTIKAKEILDNANVEYEFVDINDDKELAEDLEIEVIPTLIEFKQWDAITITDLDSMKNYVDNLQN